MRLVQAVTSARVCLCVGYLTSPGWPPQNTEPVWCRGPGRTPSIGTSRRCRSPAHTNKSAQPPADSWWSVQMFTYILRNARPLGTQWNTRPDGAGHFDLPGGLKTTWHWSGLWRRRSHWRCQPKVGDAPWPPVWRQRPFWRSPAGLWRRPSGRSAWRATCWRSRPSPCSPWRRSNGLSVM